MELLTRLTVTLLNLRDGLFNAAKKLEAQGKADLT
jgi:hypothetical protein